MRLFVGACVAASIATAFIWGERLWVEATYPGKGFGIPLHPYQSACRKSWAKITAEKIGNSLDEATSHLESNGFRCESSYNHSFAALGVHCSAFERGVMRFEPTQWTVNLLEQHGKLRIDPFCW